MALQMLRNVVVSGGTGLYFSFEHDPATVLERFVAIEASSRYGIDAVPLRRIREAMESLDGHTGGLAQRLANTPGGAEAVDAVEKYASRLHIQRASGGATDLATIKASVNQLLPRPGRHRSLSSTTCRRCQCSIESLRGRPNHHGRAGS